NGSGFPPAIPFSLTPPVPPPGAEGGINTKRRVLAATAPILLPGWSPRFSWGPIRAKTKRGRERSDPPSGAGSAIGMTNMDVWRGNRPAPSSVRDWSRARRAVAVPGDRAFSERRKARPAKRGRLHDQQKSKRGCGREHQIRE